MHPVVTVEGRCIPEVWECAIRELWSKGITIMTEYGQESKDCTLLAIVREPLSEPRIHKAGLMVGRLSQLEEYVQEICDGIHDSYVSKGMWSYTYHERLFSYDVHNTIVNQIEYVVEKLSQAPHSRRAQAITWKPWVDTKSDDPPCLQRIWLRVHDQKLIMETCWRSRDAMKAAFMNMYALTRLQALIAEKLSRTTGSEIQVGEYVDFSNSFHIYASDFNKAEGLVRSINARGWENRVWTTEAYEELAAKGGV